MSICPISGIRHVPFKIRESHNMAALEIISSSTNVQSCMFGNVQFSIVGSMSCAPSPICLTLN